MGAWRCTVDSIIFFRLMQVLSHQCGSQVVKHVMSQLRVTLQNPPFWVLVT